MEEREHSGPSPWWTSFACVKEKPHTSVKGGDILEMFQQVAVLLNSGMPLTNSILMAGEQSESLGLRKILGQVHGEVSSGSSFSAALSRYPQHFTTAIVSLVEVGETSGDMSGAIKRLRDMLKKSSETISKVISAMMYPVILIGISITCIAVMMVKVVPEFKLLFEAKGGRLPAITQGVIDLSNFLTGYFPHLLGGGVLLAVTIWQILRTTTGKRVFNVICVTTPVVGSMVVQLGMLRFAQNLSLLLKSGTPLLDAIGVSCRIFEDTPVYHQALCQTEALVAQGNSLARSLEATRLFTDLVVNMIRVGEETGNLAPVLDICSEYYIERVDLLVERVTGLAEPLIICGMGVIMASIMAAIYIPMFDLSSGGGQ